MDGNLKSRCYSHQKRDGETYLPKLVLLHPRSSKHLNTFFEIFNCKKKSVKAFFIPHYTTPQTLNTGVFLERSISLLTSFLQLIPSPLSRNPISYSILGDISMYIDSILDPDDPLLASPPFSDHKNSQRNDLARGRYSYYRSHITIERKGNLISLIYSHSCSSAQGGP